MGTGEATACRDKSEAMTDTAEIEFFDDQQRTRTIRLTVDRATIEGQASSSDKQIDDVRVKTLLAMLLTHYGYHPHKIKRYRYL